MQSWITKVGVDEIREGKLYFLAKEIGFPPHSGAMFYSVDIKGRTLWSHKPGIAVRFTGNNKLREILKEPGNEHLFAVPVPANADQRWQRRVKRLY